MTVVPSTVLRRTLTVDAVVSAAAAFVLVLAGGEIAQWLAIPESLLRSAGIVLVPFAIYVGILARRELLPRASVLAVIGMNIAWVIASLWLAMGSAVQPNAAGYAFIVGQALAVAVLAEMQYIGLRRAAPPRVAT
jgi:hypothetical protein